MNTVTAPPPAPPENQGRPVRDGLLVGAGVLAGLAVTWAHRTDLPTAVALVPVVAVATWLAVIDAREHRLPNRIVGPAAAVVTVVVLAVGLVDGDVNRGLRAIGFGLALSTILLIANLFGGLGMGDVKYGYPVATVVGWFGWDDLALALVAMTISGGLVGAIMLLRGAGRHHALSYGPFMSFGLAVGLIAAGG